MNQIKPYWKHILELDPVVDPEMMNRNYRIVTHDGNDVDVIKDNLTRIEADSILTDGQCIQKYTTRNLFPDWHYVHSYDSCMDMGIAIRDLTEYIGSLDRKNRFMTETIRFIECQVNGMKKEFEFHMDCKYTESYFLKGEKL